MVNGFIKTAAASPELIPGDVAFNVTEIIDRMLEAADEGVKLLVFPELSITGASCQDLFLQDHLLEMAMEGLQDIVDASVGLDMLIFVGLPFKKDGKVYNVTAAVKDGSVLGLVPKVWPEAEESRPENRWFESGQEIPEMIDTGIFYGSSDGEDEEGDGLRILDGGEDGNWEDKFPEGKEDPDGDEDDWDDEDDEDEWEGWDVENDPEENGDWDDEDDWDDENDWDVPETIEAPFGANLVFECTGEEGFSVSAEIGEERRMSYSPARAHALAGAVIIVNPAAAPMQAGKTKELENDLRTLSAELAGAYVYAGAGKGESSGEFVFAGSRFIAENGNVLAVSRSFGSGLTISDIDVHGLMKLREKSPVFAPLSEEETEEEYIYVGFTCETVNSFPMHRKLPRNPWLPASGQKAVCREILEMQAQGLARRVRHTGSKRMILGLSGGLDSSLALLAAGRAAEILNMPPETVLAVSMPAFGTSSRTHDNAAILAGCVGAELKEIDITRSIRQHFEDIGHDPGVHDAAFENAQARERTQILMDLSNMLQGIVVGTGDFSEASLGWCTYNGDQMSMYNVNAGLPKTVIRQVVITAAEDTDDTKLEAVLNDILDTPVSPELLPADEKGGIAQKTEELIGPYELHDFFLYYMLRFGTTPARIAALAKESFGGSYSTEEILRCLKTMYRRFFASQFKRSAAPDGPSLLGLSLSPRGGLMMPSDAAGTMWEQETDILLAIEGLE